MYGNLENSPKKAGALIGKNRVCVTRWRHRTTARAVDVVMARAKRINILIIKVSKLFFFSRRGVF